MTLQVDVLVITAHPDDAEFGAAGTVARFRKAGRSVAYVVCTDGEKGTNDRSLSPERLAAMRREEQMAAARLLGLSDVAFLGYPDQQLEDSFEFRKHLVRMIRTYRPATVITSDPYRRYLWHRDHRILGQVVLDAVFPYARDHLAYPDLLEEGLEPHKVREVLLWASQDVNHRVDITSTFETKLAALRCHESQVRELPWPDLESWLRDRCRAMARGETYELAEAFHRVEIPL
ncbi:MAG: PIG-L deacetylase family protein [Thermodesulfobacteriota bacterium]|nr:PIG-L deacetylase family protein [Thermodesulfobacteriota bacterium]